ncbi:uncharacterized protein LOC124634100 [Helicoverpa zea]|uniref:uncharacterized protein LOC124634100 n=1 Tax=Helicoverpa zea TaxID=7113 RepID=UPI001F55D1F9|nr:uncharacterized protein LOC124634100 [Helicoverpa zea]
MSLFPAYAQTSNITQTDNEVEISGEWLAEAQLLASDTDEEREACRPRAATSPPEHHQHFYVDRKLDVANLRVSTLYYPGRPQYEAPAPHAALGAPARAPRRARRRARRYHAAPAPPPAPPHHELAQRTRAFRDLLAGAPHDEETWLHFIDFQECTRDPDAALAAATEAAAVLGSSRRVRAALHRARGLALSPHRRLELLRGELAAAGGDGALLTELWLRVLACAAEAGGEGLEAAAAAALAGTRGHAAAYPHVLYAYGAYLRAAGHWERLVLLLELVASMNFPPAAFPPPPDPDRELEQERRLTELEDKALSSALPLSTVWVRVERARAAAHWRPAQPPGAPPPGALPPGAPPPALPPADPERTPAPADVAELLRAAAPQAADLLLVQMLRLAKVPLLPAAQFSLERVHAEGGALGDAAEAGGAEALLALLRAARRLPPAHPARQPGAAALLALLADPPHYFSDDAGYLRWVSALWDAACGWAAPGDARAALLCWRLRWLHSLQLLLDMEEEAGRSEARRIRQHARAALKRFGDDHPLPYAQLARLLHAAGDAPQARAAAARAASAALRRPHAHQRLYVARVMGEVSDDDALGEWACVCAALARPLPPDASRAPPPELRAAALAACEAECARLEHAPPGDAGVLGALLPAPAEWAAARARLAGGARREALLARALAAARGAEGEAQRYWEQSACALVAAAARDQRLAQCARAAAPLFPHNAFLALACGGAPLWAWRGGATQLERLRGATLASRSHRAALAHALPALLRGAAAGWAPGAAAAAACPRTQRALHAALDRLPQHKWLAVRGAAWLGAEAAALADVLLERRLRLHALLEELAPLEPTPLHEPHSL